VHEDMGLLVAVHRPVRHVDVRALRGPRARGAGFRGCEDRPMNRLVTFLVAIVLVGAGVVAILS
jgi:hypothetical protein